MPHHPSRIALFALLAAALLSLSLPTRALAQGDERTFGPAMDPKAMMADQLVLLIKKALAAEAEPSPHQYEAAHILLRLALDLNPDDAALWLMAREMSARSGHRDDQLDALRRYVNLVPADDAAQLDLIMQSVAVGQTVDERIKPVERILDSPAAAKLSAPLRSRLAIYAAQGAKELDDQPRFHARLKQAAQLDPTNLTAMRMIYDLVQARQGGSVEQGVALTGLLRADPLAVPPRRELAELLSASGAHAAAIEQYQVAQALAQGPMDDAFYYAWALSLIGSGNANSALEMFTALEQRRQAAAHAAAQQPGQTVTPAEQPTEATVYLPMDMELLRLAVFITRGQDDSIKASLSRLDKTLADGEKAGDAQAKADRLWLAALAGEAPDDAALEALSKERGQDDPLVRRIGGWTLLRRGQSDEARQALEPLAKTDPQAAYGLARLDDVKTPAGQKRLQQVIAMEPLNVAALLAMGDLRQQNVAPALSPAGAGLARVLEQLPLEVRRASAGADRWIRLSVRLTAPSYRYLQPVRAKVTVRNASDLPLALRPGGPAPSRLLLYFTPQAAGKPMANLPPIVVDLGRQLVLGPRQAIEAIVPLDHAELGWLLTISPSEQVLFNGVALLGGTPTGDGQVGMLPSGATETIGITRRSAVTVTGPNIDGMFTALEDPDMATQMQALAWLTLNAARLSGADQPGAVEVMDKLTTRLTQRYQRLDPLRQAWTVRFLSPDTKGQPVLAPIHDLAQRSDDALTRIVYLVTQVTDPASPLLDAAAREKDVRVMRFAQAWRPVVEQARAEAARKIENTKKAP
ncbi:MAG: hypothetical protein WD042_05040 [Phycisphaeraceae bacterium]